ncbi:hypothetical protein B0A81_15810 [Flavobacterium plurextorum]|uniref:Uncharacterized protein n=1 Tax=Flavobacterium plurextorum TaxID=1114867 RepID=A0ABX4CRG6_9FLAO|nr:hypothetical protein [Flavobacterium plurextorum]OXB05169.1 hypothetical protein B0A81_15810 [Flavobacterium plurextorum]
MNKDLKNSTSFLTSKEDEKIVGYTTRGTPLTVSEYKEKIQNRIDAVKNGIAKTFTSEEVLNHILKR